MAEKIGLVLAGGGGKGAYHIGVWKALREYGVDNNIQAVAGSSVGSLNAALFLHGDYDVAEKIWLDISKDQILSVDYTKLIKSIRYKGFNNKPIDILNEWAKNLSMHGVFSRKGLLNIIDNNLDLTKISNSTIPSYCSCCQLPSLRTEYLGLNSSSSERIKSILLASSALPVIFDPEEIDGRKYIDGGFADNLPIQPLYDEGIKIFIVVHLDSSAIIDSSKFPDAQIIEIIPQEDLGNVISGTLDFTSQGATRRIKQGYEDTARILKPIFEMGVIQKRIQGSLIKMHKDETIFKVQRNELLNKRQCLKEELNNIINQ